ncbi:MAG: formylglycine-generating enzyme family protein [Bacteroidales bacterium]|nr:formylglycine-generating enzyme family protein [Bacteroidales bacterium]
MRRLWLIVVALMSVWAAVGQQVDSAGVVHFAVDSVAFEMIAVEGGSFTMGTNLIDPRKPAYDAERPAHQVELQGFYIGRYEVTQALWAAVMGSNPSQWTDNDSLPVDQVSWAEAQQFVTLLGLRLGYRFRLPTEAEWEYAARGGGGSQPMATADNLYDRAWYCVNSKGRTHVVGGKEPNSLGLYDMAGNVSEWCSDWMAEYTEEPQVNPTGPRSGESRILRGGNYNSPSYNCTATDRSWYLPTVAYPYFGLRIVLESLEPEIED